MNGDWFNAVQTHIHRDPGTMECNLPAQTRTAVEKAMPADGMRAATKNGTSARPAGSSPQGYQLRARAEGLCRLFCSA
jgi:hypothetical protein